VRTWGTLELFELQNSEGPCYDAYTNGDAITIGRLDDVADRWPHFVPEARERGFRSAHAVPLLQERTIAQSSETAGQLQIALDSRIVIEQAKGRIASTPATTCNTPSSPSAATPAPTTDDSPTFRSCR
jgi:hypothetical protein